MISGIINHIVKFRTTLTLITIPVGINVFNVLHRFWPLLLLIVSSLLIVFLFLSFKSQHEKKKYNYWALHYALPFLLMALVCCLYNLTVATYQEHERYRAAEVAFHTGEMAFIAEPSFLKKFESAYQAGTLDSVQMTLLGFYYFRQGQFKGIELLRKSAKRGEPVAQYYYSHILRIGIHEEPDEIKAFEYLKKSAEQEYVYAQIDLARWYAEGRGNMVDMEESEKWLKRSLLFCSKRLPSVEVDVLKSLVNLYIVSERYDEAYGYGKRLVELQNKLKLPFIDYAPLAGVCAALKKNKEAFKYAKSGVARGYAPCYIMLAGFYRKGIGTKKNDREAEKLLLVAAQQFKSIEAFRNLSLLYEDYKLKDISHFWQMLVDVKFEQ